MPPATPTSNRAGGQGTSRRRRASWTICLTVALSLVAAACTKTPSSSDAPGTVPPVNAAVPPASIVSAPTGPAGGAVPCPSSAMTASVLSVSDTLGELNLQLQLTNVGEFDCFLAGAPSVQLLASGTAAPISVPPISGSSSAPAVTLEPNLRATVDVDIDDSGTRGDCRHRVVRAVVVNLSGGAVTAIAPSGAWLCGPIVASKLGVGPYLSAGGPDRDDNDA